MLLSACAHLDLFFNGAFLVKVWATLTDAGCQKAGPEIDCIWSATMHQSVLRIVPGFVVVTQNFLRMVSFFWMLIAVQIIFAWKQAVPLHRVRRWIVCWLPFDCDCIFRRIGWTDQELKQIRTPQYKIGTVDDASDFLDQGKGEWSRYQTWGECRTMGVCYSKWLGGYGCAVSRL